MQHRGIDAVKIRVAYKITQGLIFLYSPQQWQFKKKQNQFFSIYLKNDLITIIIIYLYSTLLINQYINNELKKGSNLFYVYLNFRKKLDN